MAAMREQLDLLARIREATSAKAPQLVRRIAGFREG
jgi:hypothetical protein